MTCLFCEIASGASGVAFAYEDDDVVVFPDMGSIRRGHVQIVPKAHHRTFDETPIGLASRILAVGQRIARVQKRLYGVDRVSFLFSGGDIPHVHAHLVPMVEKTDITSARYIVERGLTFRALSSLSLQTRENIAAELRDALTETAPSQE